MKFDMSAAWNDATRLLSANRQVLLIVAGVFFFLPSLAQGLVLGDRMAGIEAGQSGDPNIEAVFQAMLMVVRDFWWVFLLAVIVQWLGTLSMLALLTDRGRPTVGEAIRTGARLLPTLVGAQLLFSCATGLLLLIPAALGAAGSPAAGILAGLLAVVLWIYLFIKLLLVSPVIAIERQLNPIAALGRSWQLTKGNSLRLFLFVFLLVVAFFVVAGVASIIVGLVLAFASADIALVGDAIASALVEAGFSVIMVAALAAIYRQFAGPAPETVGQTFS